MLITPAVELGLESMMPTLTCTFGNRQHCTEACIILANNATTTTTTTKVLIIVALHKVTGHFTYRIKKKDGTVVRSQFTQLYDS